jgi:FtsH-binding integral membrane protein
VAKNCASCGSTVMSNMMKCPRCGSVSWQAGGPSSRTEILQKKVQFQPRVTSKTGISHHSPSGVNTPSRLNISNAIPAGYAFGTSSLVAKRRYDFIAKTYTHVAGAIGCFVLISWILWEVGLSQAALSYIKENPLSWLVVLGAFLVLGWVSSHSAYQKTKELQYLGLGLAVGTEALIFSPLIAYAVYYGGGVETIYAAALGTGILVTGLTAVVAISKVDFSLLRGLLIIGSLLALGFIVSSIVFGFELGTVFSYAMLIFASGCILYDTNRVLKDFEETRYIGAAIEIFCSVMLAFWYILRIFSDD